MSEGSFVKQLPMTSELSALIKSRVGEDVETASLAVFETIALNTLPLPGKNGTIFEQAVTMPLTLKEMVDSINSGKHIPLIADHEMWGAPKGRAFHAGLDYEDNALSLRMLFYLDPSEDKLITKLNAGSLDEVSVAFLSREFNCSECGWNYFSFGSNENIWERTCGNGHKIGQNGVHAEMVGLAQFLELSLVARGAADTPKIVGKSEAKLAPESALRLAAHGFTDPNALVVQASRGKETMDLTALTTQLTSASTKVGELTAQLSAVTGERDNLTAQLSTAMTTIGERDTTIAALTSERDTALAANDGAGTERTEAMAFLGEQLDNLCVALGEDKLEGDKRPTTVAAFRTEIEARTGKLTALLPTGGRGKAPNGNEPTAKLTAQPAAAFKLRG